MKYFIPKDITISSSSIPVNTDANEVVYDLWNIVTSYEEGAKKVHNGIIYEALTNIYPLATYSWNDVSNMEDPIVTKLEDGTLETPTAVPCVQDVTVVYVQDSWKTGASAVVGRYFLYTGLTGDVDFTTIDPSSPANFTEILNYRHEAKEPEGTTSTLYWKYLEYTNREKVTDESYSSQSIVTDTTEEWWDFELTSPDQIVLFNSQATSAKVTIYTTDINDPIYENTIDSLLDTTAIINWRTLVRYNNLYTKGAEWSIPFLTGTYNVRVTLYNPTASTIKLGEILCGERNGIGITLDGIPIQIKSSGQIIERPNGEIVLEDEGDLSKIYTIFNFTIKFESTTLDSTIDKCSEIINRRVVVVAEDSDETQYRSLSIYGFIREASPQFTVNNSKSEIKLQIQRFT